MKVQRRGSRFLFITTILIAMLSITTGAIGIHAYVKTRQTVPETSTLLIVLAAFEFVSIFSIPLSFTNSYRLLVTQIILLLLVGLGSFFSLVFFLRQASFNSENLQYLSNNKQVRLFVGLVLATLLTIGVTFGQHIHELSTWQSNEHKKEDEETSYPESSSTNDENDGEQSLEKHGIRKFLSLKASAATLVDHSKAQIEPFQHGQVIGSRYTFSSSENNFNNAQSQRHPHPYKQLPKRLPVIHQASYISTSTTSINVIQDSQSSLAKKLSTESFMVPHSSRVRSATLSNNLNNEMDYIKRIPNALLPPHLKPADKLSHSIPSIDYQEMKQYNSDLLLQKQLDDYVMESIPRASTTQEIFPHAITHPSTTTAGLRTISLSDWETHNLNNQKVTRLAPPAVVQRTGPSPSKPYAQPPGTDFALKRSNSDISEAEEHMCSIDDIPVGVNDSAEEAMKYVTNATDGLCDNEILESAVNLSQTNIHLEDTASEKSARIRGHSPHRSIFKHNRQKSSITSISLKNYLSTSVPTSPKKASRASSPKKVKLKNLSLSNIVYKETESSNVPNMTYVQELQSGSPTRRSSTIHSIVTPTKNKTFEQLLKSQNNTTPESNWSENSQKTQFPSEVIGEYDKEKWKKMQRLHLVDSADDQDTH